MVGDSLYGVTENGGGNDGAIYKINRNGSGFHELFNFEYSDSAGYYPSGSLTLVGDSLYGVTKEEGRIILVLFIRLTAMGMGFKDYLILMEQLVDHIP